MVCSFAGTLCALVYPPFFEMVTFWTDWKVLLFWFSNISDNFSSKSSVQSDTFVLFKAESEAYQRARLQSMLTPAQRMRKIALNLFVICIGLTCIIAGEQLVFEMIELTVAIFRVRV